MTNFKFDAIIFDFDGVLAESVHVKNQAFFDLYAEKGQDFQTRVYEHHLAHSGTPRYDKIRHVEREFLGQDPTEDRVQEKADRFSALVEHGVTEAGWVPGARAFLEEFYTQLPLYVASATPLTELNRIIAARSMRQYFKGVYGSPTSKGQNIKDIVSSGSFNPVNVLMIGDTMNDYYAADIGKTAFLGRVPTGCSSPFPPDIDHIEDLSHLAAYIMV